MYQYWLEPVKENYNWNIFCCSLKIYDWEIFLIFEAFKCFISNLQLKQSISKSPPPICLRDLIPPPIINVDISPLQIVYVDYPPTQ